MQMTNTAGDADRFADAHAALKADKSVQFGLSAPAPDSVTPSWLKAVLEWLGDLFKPVGQFLNWIASFLPDAPIARILLWTVLAVVACGLAWTIYDRVKSGEWRLPRWRRSRSAEPDFGDQWFPEQSPAIEWLREADALAEQGRYAEAAHHLLFRSIEDISRKRPDIVRPALTSREIGAAQAIPVSARDLFVGIVRIVERSLFGGRPVDRDDWTKARAAYANFALEGAWHA